MGLVEDGVADGAFRDELLLDGVELLMVVEEGNGLDELLPLSVTADETPP